MTIYESIIILDSLMPPKDIDAAIERFSGIIKANAGKIRKTEKWGKKRLAYEIHKKQYGFYVAIEFESAGNIPKELENEYNFSDKVLRYLTYSYDKYKLKAMEKVEDAEEIKPAAKVPSENVTTVEDNATVQTAAAEEESETEETQTEETPVEETAQEEDKKQENA